MRSAPLFGLCMEAERKALETRVQFASVQLRVSEAYKAQLQVAPVPRLLRHLASLSGSALTGCPQCQGPLAASQRL